MDANFQKAVQNPYGGKAIFDPYVNPYVNPINYGIYGYGRVWVYGSIPSSEIINVVHVKFMMKMIKYVIIDIVLTMHYKWNVKNAIKIVKIVDFN